VIISDQHRLVFIHIPKSAGTTIVHSLKSYDTFKRNFVQPFQHPRLGPVSLHHLPLEVMEEFFPEEFAKVCTYESYAVIREARRRFASALFQYVWEFERVAVSKKSLPWLRRKAWDVCMSIQIPEKRDSQEFTAFQKQIVYVRLGNRQIIKNMYPLEKLPLLANDIYARHGIELDVENKRNKRHLAHGPALQVAKAFARPICTRLLSEKHQNRLRRILHTVANDSTEGLYQGLFADERLCSFVDDHYTEDIALHNSLIALV
jgi:hypothetical protein